MKPKLFETALNILLKFKNMAQYDGIKLVSCLYQFILFICFFLLACELPVHPHFISLGSRGVGRIFAL
jgi:hypothetical protein